MTLFKHKKVIVILCTFFVLIIAILIFWNNNRASTYSAQNKLDASIIKVINENGYSGNIKIEEKKYFGSKIALYYSFKNNDEKQYAVGLLKKTLLPPYIKVIYLGYSGNGISQTREPITSDMTRNINILLLWNKDKKVKKIKLKIFGEPVGKLNEYADVSNSEIYFNVIEMKNNGSVLIERYLDKNNYDIMPDTAQNPWF